MQVSRTATTEEFGRLRIDATEQPITENRFDELLDTLQINNFTEEEKNLFQSIIEDRMITKDEFNTLSYDQLKKIKQLLSRSDLDGNFIPDTFVAFGALSVAPMVSAPDISDDDVYNEAVYNTLNKLNLPQDVGLSILKELGGLIDEDERRDFENSLTKEQYDNGVRYKTYIGFDMEVLLSNRLNELKHGLQNTTDEEVKKDYQLLIDVYTKIESEYNIIKSKNALQVEQYTRNTKQNPIYDSSVIDLYNQIEEKYEQKDKIEFDKLLETLNVNNLSDGEKELFRAIFEDEEFSNIEMDNLSYEQMKKINQLLWRKDSNGKDIEETQIRFNDRIKALLATTVATPDDDFNKTLFETVKSMEDILEINNFLLPILNIINERFKKLDDEGQMNFIVKDMNKVIDEVIEQFTEYYNNPKYVDSKEYYEDKIEQYKNFKDRYNIMAKNNS